MNSFFSPSEEAGLMSHGDIWASPWVILPVSIAYMYGWAVTGLPPRNVASTIIWALWVFYGQTTEFVCPYTILICMIMVVITTFMWCLQTDLQHLSEAGVLSPRCRQKDKSDLHDNHTTPPWMPDRACLLPATEKCINIKRPEEIWRTKNMTVVQISQWQMYGYKQVKFKMGQVMVEWTAVCVCNYRYIPQP